MSTVTLLEARADLACSNCGTTQSHLISLIFDDSNETITVERRCVCEDNQPAGTKYKEEYTASVPLEV